MSFREKSTWASLVVLAAAYGFYFSGFIRRAIAGDLPTLAEASGSLVGVVVGLIVLLVIAHIVVGAISAGEETEDERDRLISLKGEARGAYALSAAAIASVFALLGGVDPVIVVHVLLGGLIASELVSMAARLVYYRRGV